MASVVDKIQSSIASFREIGTLELFAVQDGRKLEHTPGSEIFQNNY